jgi:hypothetical protein
VTGWNDVGSLLALIDELVEAHYDTIEIVSSDPVAASELNDHIAYLQDLSRTATGVLTRTAGALPRR